MREKQVLIFDEMVSLWLLLCAYRIPSNNVRPLIKFAMRKFQYKVSNNSNNVRPLINHEAQSEYSVILTPMHIFPRK